MKKENNNYLPIRYSKFFFLKLKKKLLFRFHSFGGRNFLGRICVFHRGGRILNKYRFIDFFRRINTFGFLLKSFQDVYRSSFIGLILYFNGLLSNIILAENIVRGEYLFSGEYFLKEWDNVSATGSSIPLKYINMFSIIHAIESNVYYGALYARAAGLSALCITKLKDNCILKLNSGWQVFVNSNCMAALGRVSNSSHKYLTLKKAGRKRNLGFRPVVRGIVKNPCDHPHGGGEGKCSPPSAQRSPWGKLTKGTPSKNKLKDRLFRRKYKNII